MTYSLGKGKLFINGIEVNDLTPEISKDVHLEINTEFKFSWRMEEMGWFDDLHREFENEFRKEYWPYLNMWE